jgi:hypothetical protein
MKKPRTGSTWYFVDESGDPTYYDRKGNLIVGQPGCSPIFQNVMHRYQHSFIYFAKRGSRNRQAPLSGAIRRGIERFEQKWSAQVTTTYKVQAQSPIGEPCLSVIDYMNWAVYRAFTRGEMRYYRVVEEKISLLVDLYDTAKYPRNWYTRKNQFDIKKITPL